MSQLLKRDTQLPSLPRPARQELEEAAVSWRWRCFFARIPWCISASVELSRGILFLAVQWLREFTCQGREHGFYPWSEKIPRAMEQLSSLATATDPHTTAAEACISRHCFVTKRSHGNEKPTHSKQRGALLVATRPYTAVKTSTAKNKYIKKKKKSPGRKKGLSTVVKWGVMIAENHMAYLLPPGSVTSSRDAVRISGSHRGPHWITAHKPRRSSSHCIFHNSCFWVNPLTQASLSVVSLPKPHQDLDTEISRLATSWVCGSEPLPPHAVDGAVELSGCLGPMCPDGALSPSSLPMLFREQKELYSLNPAVPAPPTL